MNQNHESRQRALRAHSNPSPDATGLHRATLPSPVVRDVDADVVVIGGGAAGLSAALTLGRMNRRVVVIDAGEPRNAPASGVHALLGREGVPPLELLAQGRQEIAAHGAVIVDDRAIGVSRLSAPGAGNDEARHDAAGDGAADEDGASHDGSGPAPGFLVRTASGRELRARRVIVATGVVDELPAIPGLAERWGRDVIHCPYCHGWEVRGRSVAILATDARATHLALLMRSLSDRVAIVADGGSLPSSADRELLEASGVRVVAGRPERLVVDAERDAIAGVEVAVEAPRDDGSADAAGDSILVPAEAVLVTTRMTARVDFLASLGLTPVPHPAGVGEHVPADALGVTSVEGVRVVGNATDLMAQVGPAAAQASMAAAHLNAELALLDARARLAAARVPATATA